MSAVLFERPLLAKYPDARRARMPIFEPMVFPYIAIIFGSLVASVAGCWNALALRRFGLAARTLLLGVCGWLGFLGVIVALRRAGIENVAVLLILGRLWHIFIGAVQFFIHRPYGRGHEFLHGQVIPSLPTYLAAYVASRFVPTPLMLWLLGVLIVQ